jgi:hypothetical protein
MPNALEYFCGSCLIDVQNPAWRCLAPTDQYSKPHKFEFVCPHHGRERIWVKCSNKDCVKQRSTAKRRMEFVTRNNSGILCDTCFAHRKSYLVDDGWLWVCSVCGNSGRDRMGLGGECCFDKARLRQKSVPETKAAK